MALVTNAARQKRNEDLALDNVALQSDIAKEMGAELLNLHWCWIHPLFCFLYRPAFISVSPVLDNYIRSCLILS